MLVRIRGRVLSWTVLAIALTLAASGCADDGIAARTSAESADPPSLSASSPAVSPSRSPSPTRSEEAESRPPSPTESAGSDGSVRKGRGRLLSGAEMPGFNDTFTWRVESTRGREGRKPFGTCHRFTLASIGASQVIRRSYVASRPDSQSAAGHLAADFPDEKTAKRAYQVLTSWRAQCGERLAKYERREIGDLQPVEMPSGLPADSGAANWYLLTYGPVSGDPDSGYFDAQGLTRVGKAISVLEMRLAGQDYNYEPGQEPMLIAVERAAAELAP